MKRLFAAIKITPDENFLRVYYGLKKQCKYDRINWVKPENIHITLKFFGETNELKIGEISSLLSDLSLQHNPFNISLANVGIFGSSYKPRVIWFGIETNNHLPNLANNILDKMETIGFIKDRQNFVPHLTIGRIKFIDNKSRFSETISGYKSTGIQKLNISNFYLFESILSSSGPTYKTIRQFDLSH